MVPPTDVEEVFQTVLYPLLEELIAAPSDAEMTESRLSASALLCEIFIRFEMNGVVTVEDIAERWVLVLDYLDRLVSTDQSDQLVRPSCRLYASMRADEWTWRAVQSAGVLESLEDVIVVMQSAGVLEDERGDLRDESGGPLWQVTHDMIDQFMLGFMEAIIPPSPVTAVPSRWTALMASMPTERRNFESMAGFGKMVRAKVTRNPAILNGTFHRQIEISTARRNSLPIVFVFPLFLKPCVSFSLNLLFFFSIWPLLGPSSGCGRCDREEVFQPKQGSSTWGTSQSRFSHCLNFL